MKTYSSLVLLGFAVLLGGCMLAPTYVRPAAPVPSAWPQGAAYQEAGAPPGDPAAADLPWRRFFGDERLQQVIEMALAGNRDLRVAALTIEKARALYQVRRADLFPAIGVDASGSRQRLPASVSSSGERMTAEQYAVNLGFASYELDFFGRVRSLKRQALEQYLATEQARSSAQISLVAEVAGAYLGLAADRAHLRLAQDTLAAQQASYDLIQRRQAAGTSSELDLRQAQTRVSAAQVDIAAYTGLVARDQNALNLLVGAVVPTELLPADLEAVAPLQEVGAGLPSAVLLRRPDILRAENQLRAANAYIGAARAAFFPRVALTAGGGTMSNELSGLFTAGSDTWGFAPQITVPIFTGNSNRANLRAAKTDRDLYLAQYEKAIQVAFREVADALAQRGTLTDEVTAQQSLVDATAATYRLSEARYLRGIDSYLTVLDAQRSLYAAQQSLVALRLARLTNSLTLYKVLGGGLVP